MTEDSRATDNLADLAAWPFKDGAEEIVIRVARYEKDCVTPASFQALVKHRDRTIVWGIGCTADPVTSLMRAIHTFYVRNAPWPSGGEHGLHREPLIDDLLGGDDAEETDVGVEGLLSD